MHRELAELTELTELTESADSLPSFAHCLLTQRLRRIQSTGILDLTR